MGLNSLAFYQLAHQGHFDTALATLLAEVMHPDRMKLTVRHIQTWQRAVYSVLRLQAERRWGLENLSGTKRS